MTLEIDLQVLVLRGHALGYLGVIKATLPDDYYGVYVPGLGNHTLHQSSLMPLSEFKALRDDLAQARARIAGLEAVCREVVGAFEVRQHPLKNEIEMTINDVQPFTEGYGSWQWKRKYFALKGLLDIVPSSR